jgi:sulfhydrogenase subunit beta (sulfur reductase)
VVGIRPCDAAAFPLVRRNFDTEEHKDPYWLRAYEATTFIGFACSSPSQTCFCTSAGYGPFSEKGLDLLVVVEQEEAIVRVLTEKGQAFLDAAGIAGDADEALNARIEELKTAAEALISSEVPTDNLAAGNTQEIYNAAFWEDVAFACINCGTCTYLCPTCWCFDIQDENQGEKGVRMRNWDSCMFPLFTLHGSGHNPRGEKVMRVRQRFMHKLKYYVDRYGEGIQCVGCGRCVRACPVNIDIRTVCEKMNTIARADACAVS